ncbi:hypothetical protein C8F01DRAFT_143708 [Mycena amicta]|nr:hypothetical protein C8F01DRAFT_143708 [Mycena amicta]
MSSTGGEPIPPEIWSEIFSELDKNALQALCLSNRVFAQLARPHLFSSFCFRPHATAHFPVPRRLLPSAAKAEQYLERLDFWLSVDIAPLVHSCTIVPIETKYYGPFTESDNPNILMDAIVEGLARLSHLRNLSFFDVSLGDAMFATLSRMSSLRELCISSCQTALLRAVLPPSAGGPRISTITLRSSLTGSETNLIQPWLPFLDPRYLRAVSLDSHRSWNQSRDMMRVFGGVVQLNLKVSSSPLALFSVLDRFPAVQNLEILTSNFGDGGDDSAKHALAVGCRTFIGSLKMLKVSHGFLPPLLPQALSLTHLVVVSMEWPLHDELTNAFSCSPIYSMVSLTIDLNHLDLRTLHIIIRKNGIR